MRELLGRHKTKVSGILHARQLKTASLIDDKALLRIAMAIIRDVRRDAMLP